MHTYSKSKGRLRSAGGDALALPLEALCHTADPLAHLLVGISLHQTAQEVKRVAVMKRQLGTVIVRGDVEIGHGSRDRQLECLIEIDRQPLIGFVPIDALVDTTERCEVAMSCGSFADGPLRGQLRRGDAGAPSLDVSEVVEHFPHSFHRGVDLASDREFWHVRALPLLDLATRVVRLGFDETR